MKPATVTALRRAGWTVEQIVTEARASPAEVATALGADSDAVQSWTLPTLVRAVTWAEWRRAGQSVAQIAADAGVSSAAPGSLTLDPPIGGSKLSTRHAPFSPPAADHPAGRWIEAYSHGDRRSTLSRPDNMAESPVADSVVGPPW